jgi:ribonuclease-3
MLFTRAQLKDIQEKLGVVFRSPQLIELAFTHRSFRNEAADKDLQHNERLEFLGDAVLGLAVANYLYKRLPDSPEGKLTQVRGVMASAKFIEVVAEEIGLGEFLLMSKGERKSFDRRERSRPILMANAFEALLGAMYLDRGMGVVELFLGNYYFPKLPEVINRQMHIDPKSCFQELAQERWKITPLYQVIAETGPAHDKRFVVVALGVNGKHVGEGSGASKFDAETEAARDALRKEFELTLAH